MRNNSNLRVGDEDVSGSNPVPVSATIGGSSSTEVTQDTADDLQCDANLKVGDADVANGNPVPVSDAGGSLTVDGSVDLDPGASVDVGNFPLSQTVDDGGASITVDDGGVSITVDGSVDLDPGAAVDVGNFPASQTVDDGGASLTVDGSVTVTQAGDVEVVQPTRADLNANATLQLAGADVTDSNPVPVSIIMPQTKPLSGSTGGRPIDITTLSSPGQIIHSCVADNRDLLTIHATNVLNQDTWLVLEWGGTAGSDQLSFRIPAKSTRQITCDLPIEGALDIRAFDAQNGCSVIGSYKREAL